MYKVFALLINFLLADPPNILSGFNSTTENSTSTLKLCCVFEGIPNPQINWHVNSSSTGEIQQLSNSGRITITYRLDEDDSSYSELNIYDLHKSDEGNYQCIGINNVENLIEAVDSAEGFITVHGKVIFMNV